jgi:tRNA (guanine-N(7)-)-methyltransferase subunit TRM82
VTVAHGKYVVIMTSEDKCVRVLSLDNEGKLQQLSAR